MVKPGSLGLPGSVPQCLTSIASVGVHCPFSFVVARDPCRCAPTPPHTRRSLNPTAPPQGRPSQHREGLAGFCPSQADSGTSPATASIHRWAEQFNRCRRGFFYIQQAALYSQSYGRWIPPLLSLWCQRGKWVSSKVGISARVGSQAAQPPDIPSLRHSPLCRWS